MGGSGGGPFALHLAIQGASEIRDCTLLCTMGLSESFARDATSPPTLETLNALEGRDTEGWNAACARWGLPPDPAHGAWGDFTTFFDGSPHTDRRISKPIYVYHSDADPNAPMEVFESSSPMRPMCDARLMNPRATSLWQRTRQVKSSSRYLKPSARVLVRLNSSVSRLGVGRPGAVRGSGERRLRRSGVAMVRLI